MAEWSKALVLGTSLFGGVGSNPTAAKIHKFYFLNISPMKTGVLLLQISLSKNCFVKPSG